MAPKRVRSLRLDTNRLCNFCVANWIASSALCGAQQAHRNYAKRQMTWFRREPEVVWVDGFGGDRERSRLLLLWSALSFQYHRSVGPRAHIWLRVSGLDGNLLDMDVSRAESLADESNKSLNLALALFGVFSLLCSVDRL